MKKRGLSSKTDRINRDKVLAYIGSLEQYGTRVGEPVVKHMEKSKQIDTFSDYMNDETKVNAAERERINREIALIGKMIEAKENKGLVPRKHPPFTIVPLERAEML